MSNHNFVMKGDVCYSKNQHELETGNYLVCIDGKSAGGKAPDLLKKIQDEVMRELVEATGYKKSS